MSQIDTDSCRRRLHEQAQRHPGLSRTGKASKPAEEPDHDESYEVDCPWFDPTWLLDHPEFPLARGAGGSSPVDGEES